MNSAQFESGRNTSMTRGSGLQHFMGRYQCLMPRWSCRAEQPSKPSEPEPPTYGDDVHLIAVIQELEAARLPRRVEQPDEPSPADQMPAY